MTPESIGTALAGLGVAVWMGWNAVQAKQAARKATATLTTNNGGSHIKDQLDRIEGRQVSQERDLADLRTQFAHHLTAGAADQADHSRRLDRLERRRLLPFL